MTADLREETARAADLIVDRVREEEAQVQMADPRETGRTVFREAAGRVLRVARVIAVVQALVQAAAAILMAAREITEAMADREPVPEMEEAARALRETLRQKIWKRGVQITRRGISAPGKTISTRRTRR